MLWVRVHDAPNASTLAQQKFGALLSCDQLYCLTSNSILQWTLLDDTSFTKACGVFIS